MTLDQLIAMAEELRAAHGGQASVVLTGKPMRTVRTLEAVVAAKVQPNAYADCEGLGGRFTEFVVVIRS